jgi:hypothetical protein
MVSSSSITLSPENRGIFPWQNSLFNLRTRVPGKTGAPCIIKVPGSSRFRNQSPPMSAINFCFGSALHSPSISWPRPGQLLGMDSARGCYNYLCFCLARAFALHWHTQLGARARIALMQTTHDSNTSLPLGFCRAGMPLVVSWKNL